MYISDTEESPMIRCSLFLLVSLLFGSLMAQQVQPFLYGGYFKGDSISLIMRWKKDTLPHLELETVTYKGAEVPFIQNTATGVTVPFRAPDQAGSFSDEYILKWKGVDQPQKVVHDYTVSGSTTIRFDTTAIDMGVVYQGEHVEFVWHFTNVGEEDLKFENVKSSCGCVVPVWPKESFPPGSGGTIKANFNSSGRQGKSVKTLAVKYNSRENPVVILKLQCEVAIDPFKAESLNQAPEAEKH